MTDNLFNLNLRVEELMLIDDKEHYLLFLLDLLDDTEGIEELKVLLRKLLDEY